MTTVKALIASLQKYSPDAIIIMSSDAEGNSYSPLNCVFADDVAKNAKRVYLQPKHEHVEMEMM
jgi:hypothetical protein